MSCAHARKQDLFKSRSVIRYKLRTVMYDIIGYTELVGAIK